MVGVHVTILRECTVFVSETTTVDIGSDERERDIGQIFVVRARIMELLPLRIAGGAVYGVDRMIVVDDRGRLAIRRRSHVVRKSGREQEGGEEEGSPVGAAMRGVKVENV